MASVLFVGAGLASACSAFGAGDDEPPPSTVEDASNDVAVDEPTPPKEAGGGADAAEAGPPCATANQISETMAPEADGLIGPGAPDQPRGNGGICNMNVGRCVMRFAPSGAAITALRNARGIDMTLQLRRADGHVECAPNCTTAFRQPGTLSVYPLRTDWDELDVTWNARKSGGGNAWGTPGALKPVVDHGDLGGQLAVAAATASPLVTLDVSRWTTSLLIENKIGLVTDFKDPANTDPASTTNNRQFVLVMRDRSPSPATPDEPPKLTVRYCP